MTAYQLAKLTLDKEPTEKQILSVQEIMNAYQEQGYTSKSCLAYLLATARWETAQTLMPVREYKGSWMKRKYAEVINGHQYYGRGFVQITWEGNYRNMGKLIGVNLVDDPDKALDVKNAAKILVIGCMRGIFTGVGLPRFLNAKVEDWPEAFVNARKVVNGTDKAEIIAGYAMKIFTGM